MCRLLRSIDTGVDFPCGFCEGGEFFFLFPGANLVALFDQPWSLFGVLFVVLLVWVEIGHRIGLRLSVSTDEVRHEQLVGARDGISVLLSLLLGFSWL